MKVKLKDMIPNPFRDFENYQPVREVIDHLKESITSTFFWENLIGRRVNGKIEIAYGHHRLVALRELYPDGEKSFNLPVYDLTDGEMIRIMAGENETGKNMTVNHINLTVSQTKKFLEAHPEERGKHERKSVSVDMDVGGDVISRFLGWPHQRVADSLQRLKMDEEGIIDREVIESLPTERSARDFVRTVRSRRPSREDQKKVAKRIVESRKKETEDDGIYGEAAIGAEFIEEKHHFKDKKKKDEIAEFSKFISSVSSNMKILNDDLKKLIEYKEIFHSEIYQSSLETWGFNIQVEKLVKNLRNLKGGQDEKRVGALQENN